MPHSHGRRKLSRFHKYEHSLHHNGGNSSRPDGIQWLHCHLEHVLSRLHPKQRRFHSSHGLLPFLEGRCPCSKHPISRCGGRFHKLRSTGSSPKLPQLRERAQGALQGKIHRPHLEFLSRRPWYPVEDSCLALVSVYIGHLFILRSNGFPQIFTRIAKQHRCRGMLIREARRPKSPLMVHEIRSC